MSIHCVSSTIVQPLILQISKCKILNGMLIDCPWVKDQIWKCLPRNKLWTPWASDKCIVHYIAPLCKLQFSSVTQSYPTLCDPMNRSTPGLPVHHQLPEFTQTHVHWVSDVIQPSHPLSSPSPPAPNPSQDQSLFQWVNSSHDMAKVLEFQL